METSWQSTIWRGQKQNLNEYEDTELRYPASLLLHSMSAIDENYWTS